MITDRTRTSGAPLKQTAETIEYLDGNRQPGLRCAARTESVKNVRIDSIQGVRCKWSKREGRRRWVAVVGAYTSSGWA